MSTQGLGMTPNELIDEIKGGKEYFLLDVRNDQEYAKWKFELIDDEHQINLPYIDFIEEPDESTAKVPTDRPVMVLCAKGGASDYVAKILREKGYEATNITGGMKAFGKSYTHETVWESKNAQVTQFNRVGKGCLSYLLESEGQAAMVDPGRHIDYYLDYLEKNQLSLKWIFDTHLHADHISGAAALIKAAGATYYANVFDMNGAKLSYQPLCDGQYCVLGDTDIKATSLKTPGHTPGSTIIIFADAVMFTGDTLFLSSLGRPDLGGHAREWAEDLWNSVRALDRLDGDLMVLPTHTRGLVEYDQQWRVFATLQTLRKNNPLLTIEDKEVFIEKVLANLPPEPDSYQKMRTVNMGLTDPGEEERDELELGRNRCAIEQANENPGRRN